MVRLSEIESFFSNFWPGEKRGALRRKEGDGNYSSGEKEERKT